MRSGHEGTPPPGQDFGDFLRHALRAAADQVEPHADGLERIRARVQSTPARASHAAAVLVHAASGFLADTVQRWYAGRGGHRTTPARGTARARDDRPRLPASWCR